MKIQEHTSWGHGKYSLVLTNIVEEKCWFYSLLLLVSAILRTEHDVLYSDFVLFYMLFSYSVVIIIARVNMRI